MKPETVEKLIAKYRILKFPNAIGYAKTLQKRQRKGKIVDELCLQVHVTNKVPEKELRKQDVIPKSLEDIPIDIVVYGELKALNLQKTDKIRPLVGGISIGNASISAGTLSYFVEKTTSPDKGEIFLQSNSHVLVDEPKNKTSGEKHILQPGAYDGGRDVVAEYYWHKQLFPMSESDCLFSIGVTKGLNAVSRLLGRKTRFIPIIEEVNHIDFAVARINVPWEPRFFDVEFPFNKFQFVGLGFAGSDTVSLYCKQSYIVKEGYRPPSYEVANAHVNDILHKTGRTSCYSKARQILDSAYEQVNYGAYVIPFDDVAVTQKMLSPGDSGSAIWREKT